MVRNNDMDKPKVLSGFELVARGALKRDISLPEIGVKDVLPNGSWLEQKQIQSALEARKHIIEVERINKCGTLSHANWREDLMLAQVTQQTGGHWQYLGHHIDKELFLNPEEALYLIEVNCLLLKYNGVTVSLQQAYSLLLRSKITLLHYKVYASLSRLGYKLLRYEESTYSLDENISDVRQENGIKEIEEIKAQSNADLEKAEINNSGEMEVVSAATAGLNQNSGTDLNSKNEDNSTTQNTTMPFSCSNVQADDTNTELMTSETVKNKESCESMQQDSDNCKDLITSETVKNKESCESNIMQQDSDNCKDLMTSETVKNKESCESNIMQQDSDNCKDLMTSETVKNKESCESNIMQQDSDNCKDLMTSETVKNKESCESNIMQQDSDNCKDLMTSETVKNKESCENNIMQQDSNNCKDLHSVSSVIPIYKLQLLEKRTTKPLNTKHKEIFVEQVPECTDTQIVTLTVPKEEHIPRNVFLNNTTYVLNLEAIRDKTKHVRADSVTPTPYSASEEVNGDHVRRIKGSNNSGYNGPPLSNCRFRPNIQFRPNVWRPNNMNFIPFNVFFQRTFLNFQTPRFPSFVPRPPLFGMYPRFTNFSQIIQESNVTENTRKRKNNQCDNGKQVHLQALKSLAVRLKQLVLAGSTQTKNLEALKKLIKTFNETYTMKLRITDDFEIVNDENILTICLDEEQSSSKKKAKIDEDNNYTANFKRLKQMALKLKNLDSNGEINSRHKRAFSKVIKRFNKSYNTDVYLTDNFEIKDRNIISVDSSSDSDCVEVTPKATKGKKLKNPFSILKRLQKKNCTTINATKELRSEIKDNEYSTEMKETFGHNWLPDEQDFGRAEVLPKTVNNAYLIHAKREEFIFDFMKSEPVEFDNWLDVKIAFFRKLEETFKMSHTPANYDEEKESCLKCLIGPEDCMDTPSVLKKLSIIKTDNDCDTKSSLEIDFDVYNRDVQNFRKTNLPKPHFRIICISESSNFPSGKDIASLRSKIDNNIPIVFAIVGVGSISYLQINSVDIPVYITSNDLY